MFPFFQRLVVFWALVYCFLHMRKQRLTCRPAVIAGREVARYPIDVLSFERFQFFVGIQPPSCGLLHEAVHPKHISCVVKNEAVVPEYFQIIFKALSKQAVRAASGI